MTTKDQRDNEKIKRAELARQVLENPIYKAAFDALRVEIYQKLSSVSPTDTEQLQELALYLQSADKLEKTISNYYTKGKITLENRVKVAQSTNIR